MWQNWVNGIIGLILLVAALAGEAAAGIMSWLVPVAGAVVAVLAFWAATKK